MADDKKNQFHTNEHGVLLHNTIEKSGENIWTIFDYSGDIDSFIDWVKEKNSLAGSTESAREHIYFMFNKKREERRTNIY